MNEQESAPAQEGSQETHQFPPARFDVFVTTLAIEALGALGESPIQKEENPEVNLPHAQHIIDILTMLQEKTKGNLVGDEEKLINGMLYQLRLAYLQKRG